MTFLASIAGSDLQKLAAGCARIAKGREGAPILGTVMLSMARGELTGSATDGNQTISLSAPAKGHGSAVVSASKLAAIVATLNPKAQVEIEADESRANISQGRSKFQLPVWPLDHFPPPPDAAKDAIRFTVDGRAFAAAVTALAGAIDEDIRNPQLSGLHIEVRGKTAILAAAANTGGIGAIPIDADVTGNPPSVIIPESVLSSLVAIAKAQPFLTLWTHVFAIGAEAPGVVYQTKILEGNFPDWRRLVRAKSATTLMIETADLRLFVDRLRATELPYAKIEAGEVIRVTGVAKQSTTAAQAMVSEEFEPHLFEGKPATISLATRNLHWLVNSFGADCEVLSLGIDGPADNIIVKAPGLPKDNVRVISQVRV